MQSFDATSKIIDSETRTDFVSYTSDWFWEEDFDKMKRGNYFV